MKSTRPSVALLFLLAAAWLSGPVTAQPDKAAALEKAKAKFEADSAKAEEAMLASLEKALAKAKAAGNKAVAEKLTYEKDLFVAQRIAPTAVPAAAYLKQRTQAVNALEAAYQALIKDHLKNKKEAEAEALEAELSDLVKATRGYGLAFPDLDTKPVLVIENKASGQVLELLTGKNGPAQVVLAAKVGKKKPGQCWTVEREEKGMVLRSVTNGHAMSITRFGPDLSPLGTVKADPQKETPDTALFKLAEVRREVTIASLAKGQNVTFVTAAEKKAKGVTVFELSLEPKESPTPPSQLWVLSEAK